MYSLVVVLLIALVVGGLASERRGVTVGEIKRGVGGVGEVKRGDYYYHGERHERRRRRRRQSLNSVYSQDKDNGGEGSVYAAAKETYHAFMFGGAHQDASQVGKPGSTGPPEHDMDGQDHDQNRELGLPQIFSPTKTLGLGLGLGSHYRRYTPPELEPRAGIQGRGGVELEPPSPGSSIPTCTITATRIGITPPTGLRPQQALRTPSPLSGTLRGPGPHVPDGPDVNTSGDDDTGSGSGSNGGAGGGAGVNGGSSKLTASPEVMTSVLEEGEEEEDGSLKKRGMDEKKDDWKVSPVSGREKPTSEEEDCEGLGGASRTQESSGSSSSSSNQPSPSSHGNLEESEQQQQAEEPIPPFNNLGIQLEHLQASLNHLVSHATSVETSLGKVRDAMAALRDRAREALVNTVQFMEEVERVEGELGELRRAMKGQVAVGSGEGEDKGKTREDTLLGVGMQFVTKDGDQREQQRDPEHEKKEEQERETETKGKKHHTETSPGTSPKERRKQPRRGPPSGPAPGGAEWV
ncbi:LOW QUALITY PROTEIN: hypothetical protein QBC45DRAFT_450775 [Copromyces sp. CBS 386.78]|nr:LOW QUALITY PROTEIN: hypothetical protein QBC45DRAFT_450775 [Copromyces sp. CBS 386.78]